MGIEIPGEDGEACTGTGVASVDQRISDYKLRSAVGCWLRLRPGLSVAISRPDIDIRKLILQILKLGARHHCFSVQQFQVLDVDDRRFSVYEQEAVVGICTQGIGDPCNGYGARVLEAGHHAKIALALFVEFAGEAHGSGGRSGF